MVKFNDRMVTDVVQTFWAAMHRGEFITGAAAQAGTYRAKGRGWLRESGGVRPRRGRDLLGRCLIFAAGGDRYRSRPWARCPPDRPQSRAFSFDYLP
jgi:hypothetical protein